MNWALHVGFGTAVIFLAVFRFGGFWISWLRKVCERNLGKSNRDFFGAIFMQRRMENQSDVEDFLSFVKASMLLAIIGLSALYIIAIFLSYL